MSFASKVLRSKGNTVFLVLTPFPEGKHGWYFVRVKPAKISVFLKTVTSGPTNLEEYGEILKRGWGEMPPKAVMDEMKEVYGYSAEQDE